ncbi:MAG: tetratricopeptide repeat protein [Calothrix sp. MO_167.B12]|nr:tetratricopeptide repeat protein [Calothrix sp. MO_167.B12]
MDFLFIQPLLENLRDPNEEIREEATKKLWRIWFQQKGIYGLEMIERSQKLMDAGKINQAETLLNRLIKEQPDFAEAWNRRGFLYYSIGDYQKSLADCKKVIEINPVHFGALHGIGLCEAALGKYHQAIQAFSRALEIQPYSVVNQKLVLECTLRL